MNLIFKDQHLLYLNNTHQKHFEVMGFWGFGVLHRRPHAEGAGRPVGVSRRRRR